MDAIKLAAVTSWAGIMEQSLDAALCLCYHLDNSSNIVEVSSLSERVTIWIGILDYVTVVMMVLIVRYNHDVRAVDM
jgi:hypothetical protein